MPIEIWLLYWEEILAVLLSSVDAWWVCLVCCRLQPRPCFRHCFCWWRKTEVCFARTQTYSPSVRKFCNGGHCVAEMNQHAIPV